MWHGLPYWILRSQALIIWQQVLNCILLFKFDVIYFWTVYSRKPPITYMCWFTREGTQGHDWSLAIKWYALASLHKPVTPKMHASPIPGHRKWQSSSTNYIMHCHVVACGTLSWNMRQRQTGSLTLFHCTILCLALGNTISLHLMKVCWFSPFSITLVWVNKYSRILIVF